MIASTVVPQNMKPDMQHQSNGFPVFQIEIQQWHISVENLDFRLHTLDHKIEQDFDQLLSRPLNDCRSV